MKPKPTPDPKPKRKHTRRADQSEPKPITAAPRGTPMNGYGGFMGHYRRGPGER